MRIGSWLRERKTGGRVEYFNSASKLVVFIDPNNYPDGREYWSVFIMRRRTAPPSKGKAPYYRRSFPTKELAMKFARSFMKRNPMNMNWLLTKQRANTRAILNYFRQLLYRFFTGTAFMAPHGKDTFIREGHVIIARPVVRGSIQAIDIEMISGKFNRKVPITFASLNEDVSEFKKEEAYYLKKIDAAAREVWGLTWGLGIVKEVLQEHLTPKDERKQVYLLAPQKPQYRQMPQLPVVPRPIVKPYGNRWQVYVPSPTSRTGFIAQGQPWPTKEQAEKDAGLFEVK